MSRVKVIFGVAAWGSRPLETSQGYLDILKEHNVKDLDTAHIYAGSEKALGELGAPANFVIHSKAPGFASGALKRDSILAAAKQTFEQLGVKSVWQSSRTFGLSNFKPEDVRQIYDFAKSKGYVLPTVYQGNYNPVARHCDKILFPLLRELKIAFYAYSPLAGGFLVKDAETLRKGGGVGRWDPNDRVGELYHHHYNRPLLVEALLGVGIHRQ
ncbi:hypothetical protein ABVK25_000344 [Lepraria finkii]|uniref:NADP-dependent oxidoreductase domain-containing protein n=1 Tax=Lepraria finkii TaxID=1340010 RepID=A0ABR4BMM6_9LECA